MRSKIRSKFSLTPLLVLAAAAISCPPAPAAAAPCLTHSEARAQWPDQHLWWHTEARCFDNHRYGAAYYDQSSRAPPDQNPVVTDAREEGRRVEPPTRGAATPTTPVDQATAKLHTTVYYPTMEVNAWPEHPLPLEAHDMSTWPVLFDVDAPTKFDAWHSRVQGAWSK